MGAISMLYHRSDVDAIFAGYGTNRADQAALGPRIARSVINQARGHLAWHESIGNASGTAHYVDALRTAFAKIDINQAPP